ncbi:MAG: CAP domain-containing protein [Deltaproteobacteria bacterium]|nr:CAP domain-containing protein [Deltaproteobacteria bacterium]
MSHRLAASMIACGIGLAAQPALAVDPAQSWASQSGPPSPAGASDPRDATLLAQCGAGDTALHAAASQVAGRALRGLPAPDMHELTSTLHALGDPHVRARAWTIRARSVSREDARTRLQAWLASLDATGTRRCGVASIVDSEQGEAVAVVVVHAAADLVRPVSTRVRAGSWVTFEAAVLVPSSFAKVVVLAPHGSPRTIPTSFDPSTRRVMARFMADTPGHWMAQLLTSGSAGPLPSLETDIFADVAPETVSAQAPGEQQASGVNDDAVAMMVMLNATRKSENLAPLVRDVRLDAIAARHVQAMMRTGVMGHQSGDGTPPSRIDRAGIAVKESGENVAHAGSVVLAHRVLWASPSHRGNMLHSRFRRVGVAAARDSGGAVWVTQLFTGDEVVIENETF